MVLVVLTRGGRAAKRGGGDGAGAPGHERSRVGGHAGDEEGTGDHRLFHKESGHTEQTLMKKGDEKKTGFVRFVPRIDVCNTQKE